MNNTFRIFSGQMYRRVYNKTSTVDATVCAARIESVSLAVNFHQTRRCNLVVEQSIGIDQEAFALLPALARTTDLEKSSTFLLRFTLALHSITLKYRKSKRQDNIFGHLNVYSTSATEKSSKTVPIFKQTYC